MSFAISLWKSICDNQRLVRAFFFGTSATMASRFIRDKLFPKRS